MIRVNVLARTPIEVMICSSISLHPAFRGSGTSKPAAGHSEQVFDSPLPLPSKFYAGGAMAVRWVPDALLLPMGIFGSFSRMLRGAMLGKFERGCRS